MQGKICLRGGDLVFNKSVMKEIYVLHGFETNVFGDLLTRSQGGKVSQRVGVVSYSADGKVQALTAFSSSVLPY